MSTAMVLEAVGLGELGQGTQGKQDRPQHKEPQRGRGRKAVGGKGAPRRPAGVRVRGALQGSQKASQSVGEGARKWMLMAVHPAETG